MCAMSEMPMTDHHSPKIGYTAAAPEIGLVTAGGGSTSTIVLGGMQYYLSWEWMDRPRNPGRGDDDRSFPNHTHPAPRSPVKGPPAIEKPLFNLQLYSTRGGRSGEEGRREV
jgi:hypothetical protein